MSHNVGGDGWLVVWVALGVGCLQARCAVISIVCHVCCARKVKQASKQARNSRWQTKFGREIRNQERASARLASLHPSKRVVGQLDEQKGRHAQAGWMGRCEVDDAGWVVSIGTRSCEVRPAGQMNQSSLLNSSIFFRTSLYFSTQRYAGLSSDFFRVRLVLESLPSAPDEKHIIVKRSGSALSESGSDVTTLLPQC